MKNLRRCLRSLCLCVAICGILSSQAAAQDTSAESLRLPEVVITGADQSKIHRELPHVSLTDLAMPDIAAASIDESTALLQEGRLIMLVQPQEAQQRLRQAVMIDSTNPLAYLGLGDLFRLVGAYEKAADAYQQALKRSASLTEAHYQLGMLYESQLQDDSKAIRHYQAYLQYGGEDSRVTIWIRNLERRK